MKFYLIFHEKWERKFWQLFFLNRPNEHIRVDIKCSCASLRFFAAILHIHSLTHKILETDVHTVQVLHLYDTFYAIYVVWTFFLRMCLVLNTKCIPYSTIAKTVHYVIDVCTWVRVCVCAYVCMNSCFVHANNFSSLENIHYSVWVKPAIAWNSLVSIRGEYLNP